MSPSLKALLALVFVAVTGTILIQPILDAGDEPPAVEEPSSQRTPDASPTPTLEPSPTPAPSPTTDPGGLIDGPFRTQPLFDLYPSSCLQADAQVGEGIGIAALQPEGRVAFGSPGGPDDPPFSIEASKLFGFNSTGALYAGVSAEGGFVASAGAPPERAEPSKSVRQVVWAPNSLCGLRLTDEGELGTTFGKDVLVREGVRQVAFSPDGRRSAIVLEEGKTTSVWIADLDGTSMTEVQRERTGPQITLEGWSPDAKTIYLTFGPDSGLSFVSFPRASVPPLSGGVVATKVRSLEQCEDRLLGVVNGTIAEISTRGPEYLTKTQAGYSAVSCSPNGAFMAAIRDDNLFLLDGEGRELRDLTLDSGLRDIYVDWGASGTGLLFGRQPIEGGMAQVWHLAEGGAARNTGLTYTPGPGAIDWSASPPTGLVHR